jgi:shikimate 5-dehydrogenase
MRNRTPGTNSSAPVPAHDPQSADLKRRRFLFALGAGGAGAAVAVASALPGAAAAQVAAAPTDDRNAEYRATEHVRDYYRTTRI